MPIHTEIPSLESTKSQPSINLYWDGELYHKNSDQQKLVADLLIKQYAFKETDNILDVGCGDGKITAELARMAPYGKIVGIDPSDSMIRFANATFANANLHFQLGKASELSFSETFDVVTSFSSLHWEPKQKEALLCFKKALKPGGAIVLAIPGPDIALRMSLNEATQNSNWVSFFKGYQSPGKIWTANEYASLLLEVNFNIRKIEVVDCIYIMENENKYKGLLRGMLPHLSCLPQNKHEEFIDELVVLVKEKGRLNELDQMRFEVKVLEIIAHSPQV